MHVHGRYDLVGVVVLHLVQTARQIAGMVVIDVYKRQVDGMPVTRHAGHGFGTKSIKLAVERMNGNCQFQMCIRDRSAPPQAARTQCGKIELLKGAECSRLLPATMMSLF